MKTTNNQKIVYYFCVLFLITNFLLIPNLSFAQFNMSGLGKKIQKGAEKKVENDDAEDNEITGDIDAPIVVAATTAEKGINKIVWSNEKTPSGNLSEKDNSVSLKSAQPVYGTAFLSGKLKDLIREGGNQLFLTVQIDGQKTYLSDPYIFVTDGMMDKSFVQFSLVPALTDDISLLVKNENKTTKEFSELFLKKEPKVYRVTVYFEFGKTDEKIEGSFDYDITEGTELNKKVATKLRDGIADLVKLPKALMKNPALESQMLTLVNKYAKEGEKYSNCHIASADWNINKNDLGLIIDRRVGAYLVATFPDGHCEMFRKIFVQDYSGGGSYSSQLSMIDAAESAKRMNCANANK